MKTPITISSLLLASICYGYQPHDTYELDHVEIQELILDKPSRSREDEEMKIKFRRILDEEIADYIEYFIKYEEKTIIDPKLYNQGEMK